MFHNTFCHLFRQTLVAVCVEMNSVRGLPVGMVFNKLEQIVCWNFVLLHDLGGEPVPHFHSFCPFTELLQIAAFTHWSRRCPDERGVT